MNNDTTRQPLTLPLDVLRMSRPVLVATTQMSAARAIQRVLLGRKKKRPKWGRET